MTPEAWIALGGAFFTILSVVFAAGIVVSQLKSLGRDFRDHVAKNDEEHTLLFQKANDNEGNIREIQGQMHTRPFRSASGGQRHV